MSDRSHVRNQNTGAYLSIDEATEKLEREVKDLSLDELRAFWIEINMRSESDEESSDEETVEEPVETEIHMCPRCESNGRDTPSRDNIAGEWCKTCQHTP